MQQQRVSIDDPGIRNALQGYDVKRSICEYIWNGFDAGATVVKLVLERNASDGIHAVQVIDDGTGIAHDTLYRSFAPFWESYRLQQQPSNDRLSTVHGKNGIGRFSFFAFANKATWQTVYADSEGQHRSYDIVMEAGSLHRYQSSEPAATNDETGTVVRFTQIPSSLDKEFTKERLLAHLASQFVWLLELSASKHFKLLIDGKPLDYSHLVADSEEITHSIRHADTTFQFVIRFIRWRPDVKDKSSQYYYLDSHYRLRYREYTPLNRKGDEFYHSVYITSRYFDNVDTSQFGKSPGKGDSQALIGYSVSIFAKLRDFLDTYIGQKRAPYIQEYATKLVESYEEKGEFPRFGSNEWDVARHATFKQFITDLCQVRPRLIDDLKGQQRSVMLRLLNLALDSDEREQLFDILEQLVDLTVSERAQLARTLKVADLPHINRTIRMISDRFKAVSELKRIVYELKTFALERHVQGMIEKHYWLFGEQFHLVTAAEPDFEEALRRFSTILNDDETDGDMDHPDKKKEMDIFAVRRIVGSETTECIVVELKRPSKRLGEKELSQVKRYMRVIRSEERFNRPNLTWRFYLVGNAFDTLGFMAGEISNAERLGEPSLVHSQDDNRVRIYVKTWSEIFDEFEVRHSFLQKQLELRRRELASVATDPADLVAGQEYNTAMSPPEFTLPSKS